MEEARLEGRGALMVELRRPSREEKKGRKWFLEAEERKREEAVEAMAAKEVALGMEGGGSKS